MAFDKETNPDLTFQVIGGAIEVHRRLGPGLLEHTYRSCLAHELGLLGLRVAAEVPIPIVYKGIELGTTYRADLVVEDLLLVELKAVDQILPVHCMQTVTYLKLSAFKTALLINFNIPCLKDGVRRFANSHLSADRPAVDRPRPLASVGPEDGAFPAPP
jgi:GxxExxY protein